MTEVPTVSQIMAEIAADTMAENPDIVAWGNWDFNTVKTEPIAMQIQKLYQLQYDRERARNLMTATGSDLEELIKDRLPEGRLLGLQATGYVNFIRTTATESQVLIPLGTVVAARGGNSSTLTFATTVAGYIPANLTSVSIACQAVSPGTDYNIKAYAINTLVGGIYGVDYVENVLDFIGGTDSETDTELLDRYIYSVKEPGRATPLLVLEHLLALANADDEKIVSEARIYSKGQGDVEIVVDCASAEGNDTLVKNCIEENLAAGITSRGCLAAVVSPGYGKNQVGIGDCSGGRIWVRPTKNVMIEETLAMTYANLNADPCSATITIPAGTVRGTALPATMLNLSDLATEITEIPVYSGDASYDILIGKGDEYPYLFVTPEMIPVDVFLSIVVTDTPEADLVAHIDASIKAYLGRFQIGEALDYSDLEKAAMFDVSAITTDIDGNMVVRAFDGIDSIYSLIASVGTNQINENSQKIIVEEDARIIPGTVTYAFHDRAASITITSPINNQTVYWKHDIVGTSTNVSSANIYVLAKMVTDVQWYAWVGQKLPGGNWELTDVWFGRDPAVYPGDSGAYEMVAIATSATIGETIAEIPTTDVLAMSQIVTIVRP